MDTVIRKLEPVQAEILPEGKTPDLTPRETGVEVPFNDYAKEHGHPFLADYFKLGDTYEVFNEEIGTIDSYIQGKIAKGDIANSKKAVEKEIKIMEKLNNIKDEERATVRMGILSSYIRFMGDVKTIKHYANY